MRIDLNEPRIYEKVLNDRFGRLVSKSWKDLLDPYTPRDTGFFKKCGEVAEYLGITWGGKWKTPDIPHFEIDEDWQMPERSEEMTEAERAELESLKAEVAALKEQQPKVYHYTEAVPEWGRATVQRFLDKGVFSGASEDDLSLSEDMLRMMVICERINER